MPVNTGIVNGYEDNMFHPDDYMTRAELVTVIDNLLGIESETDQYISDVSSKDWYNSNIRKAMFFGLIQGNEKGKTNPNARVTREEAVVILARAFRTELDDAHFNGAYKDANKISDWARKEFMSFVRKQYIQGYEDNTVKPKKSVTRAEILTVISRIIKNISSNMYATKVNGDTLIKDRNVIINSTEFLGNLIIGEQAAKTIKLTNTMINGNLVLYAPIDMQANTISVNGEIIKAYENNASVDSYYVNQEYGISFPIPSGATTYDDNSLENRDYSKKDTIIIQSEKNDTFYYQSISEISKAKIKKLEYDSIFELVTSGEVQKYPYEVYTDHINSQLVMMKRDNVVYSILFLNVVSQNMIDNIISHVVFTEGTNITNHDTVIYRNSKLALKFSYKNGYVGVDDSYNTNQVYSGDSIFKLFIQVNMITDINNYSVEEIKSLLKTFVKNDGTIVDEEVMTINNHPAIQFEIESDQDKIISRYVIIGNNLYNFIFKGEAEKIDLLGRELFQAMMNSMEF